MSTAVCALPHRQNFLIGNYTGFLEVFASRFNEFAGEYIHFPVRKCMVIESVQVFDLGRLREFIANSGTSSVGVIQRQPPVQVPLMQAFQKIWRGLSHAVGAQGSLVGEIL